MNGREMGDFGGERGVLAKDGVHDMSETQQWTIFNYGAKLKKSDN